MEILHFEDLGDTIECHLAANAVVLVLGQYQISIATYLHIKFERDLLNTYRLRALRLSGSTAGGR